MSKAQHAKRREILRKVEKSARTRRKCNCCGKYGYPAIDDMVHTGYGQVMYSEAHFAHRACLNAQTR